MAAYCPSIVSYIHYTLTHNSRNSRDAVERYLSYKDTSQGYRSDVSLYPEIYHMNISVSYPCGEGKIVIHTKVFYIYLGQGKVKRKSVVGDNSLTRGHSFARNV